MNQLILGDNLEILKKLDSESVDLIYLDPPFFSNRNYEVIWGDEGEVRSFKDRWSGGVDHYIAWLKERVAEMHRILKPTGSIFLHCDWHANAYIRVDILDKIFGYGNFRAEIVWKRTNSKGLAFNSLAHNNDSIFYYSKNDEYTWNPAYLPLDDQYVNDFYKFEEKGTGRKYQLDNLLNPNPNRPNLTYEFLGIKRVWRWTKERMEEAYEKGIVVQTKPGTVPRLKRYLDEQKGKPLDDNWTDILNVQSNKEKIGYPTQKPEMLLKRIIEMASNEGDVVLDPFVGGGTTVAVADKLNRRWIGIDQSVQAIKVTEMRLNNQMDLFSQPFHVRLHKYDFDRLNNMDPKEFEIWVVEQFGGTPQKKKGADKGFDGRGPDGAPVQVKQSTNIGINAVKNLYASCVMNEKAETDKRIAEGKPIAWLIAFSFAKTAVEEIARLKNKENIVIRLVTVDEIIPISKKPSLTVLLTDKGKDARSLTEVEFQAEGKSAAGIEFYSWDFDYNPEKNKGFKPEILLDKTGTVTHKFKPGQHTIACKVVDNDGLENVEVVKLKVNGVVERN